ncbi:hypothetical protein AVEN_103625-1 [Araneus ventricosus]|uniref:Uncharacterized protein n=1 Tax=Araneus ventricosus TaxID=182803 RepID=A0A4Y2HBF9_ARAVE|nr:hypothetical protein AVEN_103625-1 [Araneus ventricosus]
MGLTCNAPNFSKLPNNTAIGIRNGIRMLRVTIEYLSPAHFDSRKSKIADRYALVSDYSAWRPTCSTRLHIYKPYPDRTEAGNQSISLATRSTNVVFSSRT